MLSLYNVPMLGAPGTLLNAHKVCQTLEKRFFKLIRHSSFLEKGGNKSLEAYSNR